MGAALERSRGSQWAEAVGQGSSVFVIPTVISQWSEGWSLYVDAEQTDDHHLS